MKDDHTERLARLARNKAAKLNAPNCGVTRGFPTKSKRKAASCRQAASAQSGHRIGRSREADKRRPKVYCCTGR